MRLFGVEINVKRAPPPVSLQDVMEMTLGCQDRVTVLDTKLEAIRKEIAATQRKVYRTAAEGIPLDGENPPDGPLFQVRKPQTGVQAWRTGDIV